LSFVAEFGTSHYRIEKQVSKKQTSTMLKLLNEKMREEEIARMLGGEKITAQSLAHASQLLVESSD